MANAWGCPPSGARASGNPTIRPLGVVASSVVVSVRSWVVLRSVAFPSGILLSLPTKGSVLEVKSNPL
jgi:hypothetical protein